MRRTRDILMAELWTSVALVALIVVVFETGLAMPGMLAGQEHIELLVGMIMIIIVLTCIPLSLYLFRLKHVQARLIDDESSSAGHLLFWGTVRMMMLCVPMVVSMFLYYAFGLNVRLLSCRDMWIVPFHDLSYTRTLSAGDGHK